MSSEQHPVFEASIAHAEVRPMTVDEIERHDAWRRRLAVVRDNPGPPPRIALAGDKTADREHAFDGSGTLCGLAESDVDVYRHLFEARAYKTCHDCRAGVAGALVREGMRCVAARQIHCVDEDGEQRGGFELSFDDDSAVGFTLRSDWTLTISGDYWSTVDPRWRVEEVEAGVDGLGRIVGQSVVRRDAHLNEVGEFQGFDITFPRSVMRIGQWGGELTVVVEPL
jgi:hypothetical protein